MTTDRTDKRTYIAGLESSLDNIRALSASQEFRAMQAEAENRALHTQLEQAKTAMNHYKATYSIAEDNLAALHSQLEACNRSNAELLVCGAPNCEPWKQSQARLTALEAEFRNWQASAATEIEDKTERITQLEGALKWAEFYADRARKALAKPCMKCGYEQGLVQVVQSEVEHAQHLLSSREEVERPREDALTPGAYREWCRDPTLCQDKGTCPRDPSCAD